MGNGGVSPHFKSSIAVSLVVIEKPIFGSLILLKNFSSHPGMILVLYINQLYNNFACFCNRKAAEIGKAGEQNTLPQNTFQNRIIIPLLRLVLRWHLKARSYPALALRQPALQVLPSEAALQGLLPFCLQGVQREAPSGQYPYWTSNLR